MSNSRRKFLKAGVLAAMFAAVPLKNVLGYSWKDRHSADPFSVQDDPLANYTKATFIYYLNSVFQLHAVYGVVAVTLTKVDDLTASRGGECFSLLFRGGGRALPQGTYTVEHPALGRFLLFLVPAGTDSNGAQGYLATINRLTYNDALAPAPSGSPKRAWIIQMEDTKAPTNTSPSVNTPAQPAAPVITKPEPKSKPVRKIRKPSSKRSGDFDDYEIN